MRLERGAEIGTAAWDGTAVWGLLYDLQTAVDRICGVGGHFAGLPVDADLEETVRRPVVVPALAALMVLTQLYLVHTRLGISDDDVPHAIRLGVQMVINRRLANPLAQLPIGIDRHRGRGSGDEDKGHCDRSTHGSIILVAWQPRYYCLRRMVAVVAGVVDITCAGAAC